MSILENQDIKLSKTNIRSQLRKNGWDRILWGSMIHNKDKNYYCYEKIISSETPKFYLYNGCGSLDAVYFPDNFQSYVNLYNLIDSNPSSFHGCIQGQLYISLVTRNHSFNKLYKVQCYMDIESILSYYKDILTTRSFEMSDVI